YASRKAERVGGKEESRSIAASSSLGTAIHSDAFRWALSTAAIDSLIGEMSRTPVGVRIRSVQVRPSYGSGELSPATGSGGHRESAGCASTAPASDLRPRPSARRQGRLVFPLLGRALLGEAHAFTRSLAGAGGATPRFPAAGLTPRP